MGKNSSIQWTDHSWNPWQGCHKVSAGCKNCFMFRQRTRWGDPNVVIRSRPATFQAPLTWKEPALVFACSWSDFFIEEADEWRPEAWDIMRRTPHLIYQIPTKRPERIPDCLPADWGEGWRNVWLGISAENQETLEIRWEYLCRVPARLYWLSAEPLLGSLDLSGVLPYVNVPRQPSLEVTMRSPAIGWVVTGGESGPSGVARAAELDWFRGIRDQCLQQGVPYFHKQHGGSMKVDGAWGGCILDGHVWHDFPLDKPLNFVV